MRTPFTLCVLLACIAFIPACSDDDPTEPQQGLDLEPGDLLISTLEVGGVLQYTRKDTVITLGEENDKQGPEEEELIMGCVLPIEFDVVTDDPNILVPELVTPQELDNFLASTWDAHIEGAEDDGVNADEFLRFLREDNRDVSMFMDLWRDSAMEIGEFVGLLREMDESLEHLHRGHTETNCFLHYLHRHQMTLEDFNNGLSGAGHSASEFFGSMGAHGISFNDLTHLHETLEDEDFGFVELVSLICNLNFDKSSEKFVTEALAVTKVAFDILKDGAPQTATEGASTAVLSGEDLDWRHYAGSLFFESESHKWTVTKSRGWLPAITWVEVEYSVLGSYGASHISEPGVYVQEVTVSFDKANAKWPMSVDGSASVSRVVNAGTFERPVPQFRFDVLISANSWFYSPSNRYHICINGEEGVVDCSGK